MILGVNSTMEQGQAEVPAERAQGHEMLRSCRTSGAQHWHSGGRERGGKEGWAVLARSCEASCSEQGLRPRKLWDCGLPALGVGITGRDWSREHWGEKR